MRELVFEIAVEELPALAIEPAVSFIRDFLDESFTQLKLEHRDLEVFGTPRRLVVLASIAEKQTDITEEITGPNVQAAYVNGDMSPAALGFMRAKGLDKSQIYHKATDKGEVLAATMVKNGEMTKTLLPPLFVDMLTKIPFKKRMRWDASGDTFARPLRSLMCLFGSEYLDISYANITSSNTSAGHRFMSPEPFVVTSREQYLSEMKKRHVVLSSVEREKIFIAAAESKLKKIGVQFRLDEELMATVRNLAECPFVIFGSFDKKYLEIPSEILVCEMKAHQKCFAVYDDNGALLPYFICGAATLPYDEEVFAKGNERVLRARFEDGAFYFAEDIKKSIDEHARALSSLVFERELGTVLDKSKRIEAIAVKLAHVFGLNADEKTIKLAAPLIKADLVTGVVGQFPELQGIMGKIYASRQGIDADVCECIETHYWPRFACDNMPRLTSAALLSIADKLDTLVGIIAIGKRPMGNKDPFALRRCGIGIVRMLVHFGFSIECNELIKISLDAYGDRFKMPRDEIVTQSEDFIMQRARGLLIDELKLESFDRAVSFADSVLSVGGNNVLDAFARGHTLLAMHSQSGDEFTNIVQTFKRASNIVKKASESGIAYDTSDVATVLVAREEKELWSAVSHAKALMRDHDGSRSFDTLRSTYSELFSQVVTIKPKLDAFFDHVMVMVDDAKVRNARLTLLSEIKVFADRIADFTHL